MYSGRPPDWASKVVGGWDLGGLAWLAVWLVCVCLDLPNASSDPFMRVTVCTCTLPAEESPACQSVRELSKAIEASGWGQPGGAFGAGLEGLRHRPAQPVCLSSLRGTAVV